MQLRIWWTPVSFKSKIFKAASLEANQMFKLPLRIQLGQRTEYSTKSKDNSRSPWSTKERRSKHKITWLRIKAWLKLSARQATILAGRQGHFKAFHSLTALLHQLYNCGMYVKQSVVNEIAHTKPTYTVVRGRFDSRCGVPLTQSTPRGRQKQGLNGAPEQSLVNSWVDLGFSLHSSTN